jgi:hypothetical protein
MIVMDVVHTSAPAVAATAKSASDVIQVVRSTCMRINNEHQEN